jgi:hypothetical protein
MALSSVSVVANALRLRRFRSMHSATPQAPAPAASTPEVTPTARSAA